jgi:hypothetical protein
MPRAATVRRDGSLRPTLCSRMTRPRFVSAVAVAAYLCLSIPYLSKYPLVGEDEPWIAAAPAKLAAAGTLGNDLFTGYYRMERHPAVDGSGHAGRRRRNRHPSGGSRPRQPP